MPFNPPQELADRHTRIAQRYAGYFFGHLYRAAQQRTGAEAIRVDWSRPWREPAIVADGCVFCRRLTDAEVERRVAGYQHALDVEVLRARLPAYAEWLNTGSDDIPEREGGGGTRVRGINASAANRRRFIERHIASFDVPPLPLVELPLRLKRKLCIEWNHLYRDWMRDNPDIQYDFETHEFFRDLDQPQPPPERHPKDWWRAPGAEDHGSRGGPL